EHRFHLLGQPGRVSTTLRPFGLLSHVRPKRASAEPGHQGGPGPGPAQTPGRTALLSLADLPALTVKGVTIVKHPLLQHNLTRLRDECSGPQEFRRLMGEVAALMLYEATHSFAVKPVSVRTPLERTRGCQLQREVVLVPVLRAGLGMLDSILQLIPHAR